ncbi:MAG TPA: bifunctional hydroxymethylpyrimidine kinase/phosphomethylpyrimidine kinase [Verrucomicrobiae bacterium]|nr:bifunctional hydroxymethylpyrimidine kinase/phosphomethylpyrimidine kinase [Verrucomicrobiae bacterium]
MKELHPRRRQSPRELVCALTIAGSDSGGGAGIQADLKTFAALGVHGTSAITCVTAQNPKAVRAIHPLPAQLVADQIESVFEAFSPRVVKTGMLYNVPIIESVLRCLENKNVLLIVDPVLLSTSGSALLKRNAEKLLVSELLPRATLVTPNLMEAEHLLQEKISSPEGLRHAARQFPDRFGCAALVKGGHLHGGRTAVDFYFDGQDELILEAPYIRGITTHGTGCTYSAAIASHCALGLKLPEAVIAGKEFIANAIRGSYRCGSHDVLNSFWGNEVK